MHYLLTDDDFLIQQSAEEFAKKEIRDIDILGLERFLEKVKDELSGKRKFTQKNFEQALELGFITTEYASINENYIHSVEEQTLSDFFREFPWDVYKKAADLDMIGGHFAAGGDFAHLNILQTVLIIEEFSKYPLGLSLTLGWIPGNVVQENGSPEQIEKYLRLVRKGDSTFSILATEPGAGSRLYDIVTHAKKNEAGKWVINGSKHFITNGTTSHFGVVLCRIKSGRLEGKHIMLIVDLNSEGVRKVEMTNKILLYTSPTSEVGFTNVVAEEVLGDEGKGFECMIKFLDSSRVSIAAQGVGIAQAAYDKALEFAKSREIGNKRVIDFQEKRNQLAEMKTNIEAARQLTYYAARLIDSGKMDGRVSSMAKYLAAQVAVEVAERAAQIHGGYRHFGDYLITILERDAKILPTYEGTEDMQLQSIAMEYERYKDGCSFILENNVLEAESMLKAGLQEAYNRLMDTYNQFKKTFNLLKEEGLLQKQAVKFSLAKMETDILAAQVLSMYAASYINSHEKDFGVSDMAKQKAYDVALNNSTVCKQLTDLIPENSGGPLHIARHILLENIARYL